MIKDVSMGLKTDNHLVLDLSGSLIHIATLC